MINFVNYVAALLIVIIIVTHAHGQGCSDAGLCSIGSTESANHVLDMSLEELLEIEFEDEYKQKVIIGENIGIGEEGVLILTTEVDLSLCIGPKTAFISSLNFRTTRGQMGGIRGFGDPMIGVKHILQEKDSYELDVTIATKIPAGDGNDKSMDKVLPMPYQRSLGTLDLILGSSLQLAKWKFAVGYQQVLANYNRNGFAYEETIPADSAAPYFQSASLKRGNDVMMRIERIFQFKKYSIVTGLMPIYRITPDRVELQNEVVEIAKSSGLTLNATLSGIYKVNNRNNLLLNLGMPLIVREARNDGLTRMFVAVLSWEYRF